MPGSKRQRADLKTSIQQRQEQQRDRPTSTAKTSGGGLGGQQSGSTGPQPVHLRLEPTPAPPTWSGEPLNAPKANVYWPGPTRPSAFEIPAPSLPEVRARLDTEPAHLPQQATGPLSVDEEEALDLLHALIDRIPHAQLECRVELLARAARAAVRAIREAQ